MQFNNIKFRYLVVIKVILKTYTEHWRSSFFTTINITTN